MNSKDWTELLISVLFGLLSAYLKRNGQDAAQEVISRVSHDLTVREPQPVKLSELARLSHLVSHVDIPTERAISEKEQYRMQNGHLPA